MAWEGHEDNSLFYGHHPMDDVIQKLIEHAQAVSFWVSAEIMCCSSTKVCVTIAFSASGVLSLPHAAQ